MFEEKVGINYTILKKYLLELNGPKTYNGKNNKTKDEATWRNVVKKVKWNIQYHASSLDWRFISYMILYVLQCHSPKSSHPLPLPQSPKDCSIHLCLFEYLIYNRADFKGKWTVLFNFLPLRVILKLCSLWFIYVLKVS